MCQRSHTTAYGPEFLVLETAFIQSLTFIRVLLKELLSLWARGVINPQGHGGETEASPMGYIGEHSPKSLQPVSHLQGCAVSSKTLTSEGVMHRVLRPCLPCQTASF